MTSEPDPRENDLPAALPDEQWRRWQPHLEAVDMALRQVLYESGGLLSHVTFPTTSIVSLLYVMQNGSSAEIAVVGHEGMVGIWLFMGGETTPNRALVQSAGRAWKSAVANAMRWSSVNTTACCPPNWPPEGATATRPRGGRCRRGLLSAPER